MGAFYRSKLLNSAGCALAMGMSLLTPLGANAAGANPERFSIDPLGVDIATGRLMRKDTHLAIGDPSSGGLSWRYLVNSAPYVGSVYEQVVSGTKTMVWVNVEGNETTFIHPSTSYSNGSGTGATLTKTASNWIFTDDAKTVYTFGVSDPRLTSIQKADGTKITITYNATGLFNINSVVSNQGYAFKYTSTGTIYGVNLSAHTCDANINCDAYDTSISVSGSEPCSPTTNVTDALGKLWQYQCAETYESPAAAFKPYLQDNITYFRDPTGYSVTLSYNAAGQIISLTDPRGVFTYGAAPTSGTAFNHPESARSYEVKDPSGALVYKTSYLVGAVVYNIIDADGLKQDQYTDTTTVGSTSTGNPYSSYTRVTLDRKYEPYTTTSVLFSTISYLYDGNGNVTSATLQPKSGSGLTNIVTTASYSGNSPIWTKDGKGNQTDYTYDATHKGLLTVTLPADQNGLRTRTYNTYTAFNSGNGNIYRLTRSETCGLAAGQLTLTACPAATTTSVTVTDYGTSSTAPYTYKTFLPYQMTQTDGANSLSATTTYGYDPIGNVVSVDGPLAGSDDKGFKTYNANRRVVCEIGADPDGGGALIRAMVRHTYDDAGRELKTEQGTGTSTTSCLGANMTVASFTRMTYDAAGRLAKSEVVQP